MSFRVGKALAQARSAKLKPDGKSMTQKDLATAVNAKPQDVSRRFPCTTSITGTHYPPLRYDTSYALVSRP